MALTASVQCDDTNDTITFDALDNTDGRKLLDVIVGAPLYDIKRWHVPGSDGNSVVFCGQMDRRIVIVSRYIGTAAAIKLDFEGDKVLFAQQQCTITDDAGQTYDRCTLAGSGQVRRTTPLGLGEEDTCFFDVSFEFQED